MQQRDLHRAKLPLIDLIRGRRHRAHAQDEEWNEKSYANQGEPDQNVQLSWMKNERGISTV